MGAVLYLQNYAAESGGFTQPLTSGGHLQGALVFSWQAGQS